MHWLHVYFPGLTEKQTLQFDQACDRYFYWNARINVISRKDIENLKVHHVLHALSIARVITFKAGTSILDAGTGGGFPGIPLAIFFPEVKFTLVDSVTKKIKVVNEITAHLGLTNVRTLNTRFESLKEKHDFVTGRAVSNLNLFCTMVKDLIKRTGNNDLSNGILYLTGGEPEADLSRVAGSVNTYHLSDHFPQNYFSTKKLIHIFNLR